MRIACVTTSKIPSTTANSIQVMKTCNALAGLGHEVRVWSPDACKTSWDRLADQYGLAYPFQLTSVKTNHALKRYDFAWKTAREAKKWKADVFYTWLIPAGRFAQKSGLPVILELHDRLTGHLGPYFFKKMIHSAGKKRIAIITRALQTVIERQAGIKLADDEVAIAPNGVDIDRFSGQPSPSEARKFLKINEKITAVFSGHLYAGRGIALLADLALRMPEVQFLWVGGKPEDVDEWRNKLAERSIHNVVLTGFINNKDLPLYLAAGDVLLMPYERKITGSSGGNSAEICSPMKMFEYMATGRAILASDLPVIKEVLNDERAIFAQPEDISSWQKALQMLIQEPKLRKKLGSIVVQEAGQYSWMQREKKILAGFTSER